jgi:NitT/TauT family transport system substrate-binding protein
MPGKTLHRTAVAAGAAALAVGVAACGGSSSSSGSSSANASNVANNSKVPTVTLMVGGIDKQIYLPYQLAQGLGYYKKYGVNVKLSTEQNGGVGAEDAMASGQVDMAGAWYVHTIEFQDAGKNVVDVVQLSGAPGEREMCATGSGITSAAQWKGKSVGVTDLGSGTDDLTRYLAAQNHLTTKDFTRVGVGAGSTFVAAIEHHKIACGMTSQPTVIALEKQHAAYSAIDLASTAGAEKALGGTYPAAGVLARAEWVAAHKDTVQKVVDALVATMHYIATHSAADIADHMPAAFVSNGVVTRADYITALNQDKGQFLPDGLMPANGPQTVLNTLKFVGKLKHPAAVDLSKTYTNEFATQANSVVGNG